MCESECDSDVMLAPAYTSIKARLRFGKPERALCLACARARVSVSQGLKAIWRIRRPVVYDRPF